MNSATALVASGAARFVAKWSRDVASLDAGCFAAAMLGSSGLHTGAPCPSRRGALTEPWADGALALLRHVPGRELAGDTDVEQALIGTTLARAHRAGRPEQDRGPFMTEWLSPAGEVLSVAGWLPDALAVVRRDYAMLPTLTWTQLHTDPAPEAFIHDDAAGTTGLVDWAGSRRGPVLYDVASAVMYLGGLPDAAPFLAAYEAEGLLDATELSHLATFGRLRWAIQASYFAARIASDDQTGVADDPDHNRESLERAWRGLEARIR